MFLLFEVEHSIVLVRNTKKSHQKVLSVLSAHKVSHFLMIIIIIIKKNKGVSLNSYKVISLFSYNVAFNHSPAEPVFTNSIDPDQLASEKAN